MLHDVVKSILSTHQNLLDVAATVKNNIAHLKPAEAEDTMVNALY